MSGFLKRCYIILYNNIESLRNREGNVDANLLKLLFHFFGLFDFIKLLLQKR